MSHHRAKAVLRRQWVIIKKLVLDEDIERFRKEFVRICNKEVNPLGVLIMRHEIHRPNFIPSEKKTVNKVHDFQEDKDLFRYCTLPESLPIKFFHGLLDYDEKSPRVHIITKQRDTVFFDPLFIHGSRANRFLKVRKPPVDTASISCRFASSECCYIDVKNMIQGHLEK